MRSNTAKKSSRSGQKLNPNTTNAEKDKDIFCVYGPYFSFFFSPVVLQRKLYNFLSDRLRLRLNHFFLFDLSLPSKLPSSDRLSVLLMSSMRVLLLLPPLMVAPKLAMVRTVVNEECIWSLWLSNSSTCIFFKGKSLREHIKKLGMKFVWWFNMKLQREQWKHIQFPSIEIKIDGKYVCICVC